MIMIFLCTQAAQFFIFSHFTNKSEALKFKATSDESIV